MLLFTLACAIEAEDVCTSTDWYYDTDGDGLGNAAATTVSCEAPAGYVDNADDCDDTDVAVGVLTWYADGDADGHGTPTGAQSSCEAPSAFVASADDCDDADAGVHPDADERCNGTDDDCDGLVDDLDDDVKDGTLWYDDVDGDTYGDDTAFTTACAHDGVAIGGDCDDGDPSIHPGALEYCNEVDDDCSGEADEDGVDPATWYLDADGDDYGDATAPLESCAQPERHVGRSGDCDDLDATLHPDAVEVCDDIDNDCDDTIDLDAAAPPTWYADDDGDGFGDAAVGFAACEPPSGYISDATDCDDREAAVSPAGSEACGGGDEDCDGETDEDSAVDAAAWYLDADGDGYGSVLSTHACANPGGLADNADDCDDALATVSPAAAETCNDAVDDDCDGIADDGCGPSGTLALSDADATLTGSTYLGYAGNYLRSTGDLLGTGGEDLLGVDSTGAWIADGPLSGDSSVSSLVTITVDGGFWLAGDARGDWDGDGLTDLLLTGNTGSGYSSSLFYGPVVSAAASSADKSGLTMSGIVRLADIDADDHADAVACAYTSVSFDYGPVVGVNGIMSTPSTVVACDSGPDVDGDGLGEVAIGAEGSFWLVLGADVASGSVSTLAAVSLTDPGGYTGQALALAEDADGDGYADLVVADHNDDGFVEDGGTVTVLLGPDTAMTSLSVGAVLYGGRDANAGGEVAVADVDGDGISDLLIEGGGAGEAYLQYGPFIGASTSDLGSAHATFTGASAGLGVTLAGPDLDAIGQATVAFGYPHDSTGATSAGRVYLFAGGGR